MRDRRHPGKSRTSSPENYLIYAATFHASMSVNLVSAGSLLVELVSLNANAGRNKLMRHRDETFHVGSDFSKVATP